MTDFTHHTPRLLSEADAAADLAGVPRPVSEPSELTLILAEHDRDCLYSRTGHIADINTMLITREKLRSLVSERDALAVRVTELEAEVLEQCRLNGMGSERELALMGRVSGFEGLIFEIISIFFPDDLPGDLFLRLEAAITTPESKP